MFFKFNNPTIRNIFDIFYDKVEPLCNFENEYNLFIDFLNGLPPEINMEAMSKENWMRLFFR